MTKLVINPVAFQLGSLSVKWYGIIMAVAIVLATWMAISEGKKGKLLVMILSIFFYGLFHWGMLVLVFIM